MQIPNQFDIFNEENSIFVKPIGDQRARLVTRNFAAFYLRLARVGFARRTSFKMKLMPLSQGNFAQVDDEDYEWLNHWKWYSYKSPGNNTYYACKNIWIPSSKKYVKLIMHRMIMGVTDPDVKIDHKDRDGLNNTRKNLRVCTHSQNIRNSPGNTDSSSRFKGVSWNKQHQKWHARIMINRKSVSIGLFVDEELAAIAYDKKAAEYFGEFAFFNFSD